MYHHQCKKQPALCFCVSAPNPCLGVATIEPKANQPFFDRSRSDSHLHSSHSFVSIQLESALIKLFQAWEQNSTSAVPNY